VALRYLNTNAEAKAELQTLLAAVEMLVVLQYISPSSEINSAEPRLAEIEIQLILIFWPAPLSYQTPCCEGEELLIYKCRGK
jgi:accessory gene regulator protein AgrB